MPLLALLVMLMGNRMRGCGGDYDACKEEAAAEEGETKEGEAE